MIKLNSIVTDSATGMKGIVDMLHIEIGGEQTYRFQPADLNPKTKEPVDYVWAKEQRLVGGEQISMPNLPLSVLGTEVEDIGTGFCGTAISLAVHSTGCVHFNVQAKGKTDEGNAIKVQNFSILRLKGKAIKKLSEDEAAKERAAKPSPGHHSMPPRMG